MNENRIKSIRAEIDTIDREMVALLSQRAKLALEVYGEKRALGIPICDPEREAAVLAHMQSANDGPLPEEALKRIALCIVHECRSLEEAQPAQQAAHPGDAVVA